MSLDKEIRENLRYDPITGDLWWTKPRVGRCLSKPAGWVGKERVKYKRLSYKLGDRKYHLTQHRIAWFLYYGSWPSGNLDHKDQNGLNNRIKNLRECTNNQNGYNMSLWGCGRLFTGGHNTDCHYT